MLRRVRTSAQWQSRRDKGPLMLKTTLFSSLWGSRVAVLSSKEGLCQKSSWCQVLLEASPVVSLKKTQTRTRERQCCHFWFELAGLGPNSDLFGKIGPKKVWIGDQKSDFSPKLTYLTTPPEFDYPTFSLGINTLKEQGSQVVKLFAESLILSNFWSDFGLIFS